MIYKKNRRAAALFYAGNEVTVVPLLNVVANTVHEIFGFAGIECRFFVEEYV